MKIEYTSQFKRDAKKHFLALVTEEWADVLHCLINGKTLDNKYRDHALINNLKGVRDCHIRPDLVLLYSIDEQRLTLIRLGSHADLDL